MALYLRWERDLFLRLTIFLEWEYLILNGHQLNLKNHQKKSGVQFLFYVLKCWTKKRGELVGSVG